MNKRRDDVNTQCDALLAEIEARRNFFLSDLEYEERLRQTDTEDLVNVMDKIQGSAQALLGYAKDVMKEDVIEFLEVREHPFNSFYVFWGKFFFCLQI